MLNHGLLLIAAIIWGFGFVATKLAFESFDPYWLNTLRFVVASFFCIPMIYVYKSYSKPKKDLILALFAGACLFFAMHTQTLGLNITSVAKSGFITSLYVFFVPMIAMIFFRKRFTAKFWFLVMLAVGGVSLLCELKIDNFNIGDFYTLLCALLFAVHILIIERIAKKFSAFELNAIQIIFCAIIGLIISYKYVGIYEVNFTAAAIYSILFLAVFSSLIAFSIQNHCQKYIPSHIVGLFFLLESPFAAIFGFIILKEALEWTQILGCILILTAVVGVNFSLKEVSKAETETV